MADTESKKGLLNQQQLTAVFGVNAGDVARWIAAGMPVEPGKMFNLISVGQWIVQHLTSGYMKEAETAEMFGVEPRTLRKWVTEFGCPKPIPRVGLYKRDDVVKWREKYLDKKMKEVLAGGVEGINARQRMYRAKAIREEWKQALEERSLIRLEEVMPVFEEALKTMKQRLTVMPRRAAPLMEGTQTNAEREDILRTQINEVLTELARTPDALRSVGKSAQSRPTDDIRAAEAAAENDNHRVGGRKSRDGKRKRSTRTRTVSKRSRTVPKRTTKHVSRSKH